MKTLIPLVSAVFAALGGWFHAQNESTDAPAVIRILQDASTGRTYTARLEVTRKPNAANPSGILAPVDLDGTIRQEPDGELHVEYFFRGNMPVIASSSTRRSGARTTQGNQIGQGGPVFQSSCRARVGDPKTIVDLPESKYTLTIREGGSLALAKAPSPTSGGGFSSSPPRCAGTTGCA